MTEWIPITEHREKQQRRGGFQTRTLRECFGVQYDPCGGEQHSSSLVSQEGHDG